MSERSLKSLILLSVLAALLTLVLKFSAYLMTGSVGLLSDAAESIVNLLAAVTAYLSLWYSSRPVDASHTYGHEKIEYFSSGLEGILILVAAGGIAYYAVDRLLNPAPLHDLDLGLAVALVASLINLAVAQTLLRVGRARRSIVLEADGQHLMTDVWTSVAVLVSIGVVGLTGIEILDPLIALAVAGNIVWTALSLIRRSFDGLMDHSLPEADQALVRAAIESCLSPGMDYHLLRTRQAGARRFADFHLLVPGAFSVFRAHALAGRIEEAVARALPDIEVTIHIEPIEEEAAYEESPLRTLEEEARLRERNEQDGSSEG